MTGALPLAETSKCVRCGVCKTLCPTYLTTGNESLGARGRIAMLGELDAKRLKPGKALADRIFSCMLCGACKGTCPTGIDIPETIYRGRAALRTSYRRGRLLRQVLKTTLPRPDSVFTVLRIMQKVLYRPLYRSGVLPYMPEIASQPFNKSVQVYKTSKKTGRIAIFGGCSVNHFYPHLGGLLSRILLSRGYEVVVFKGEVCCGAPLRSLGMEQEAAALAGKNIDHFSRVRAEAIISMCPTCTMVIREQYPVMTRSTIENIMDVTEFLDKYGVTEGLETAPAAVTYHDPCHLSFGLGLREQPRKMLRSIKGVDLVEMRNARECCGFAGLFSLHFKDMAKQISESKIVNIRDTGAGVVVTACPGCIMQLESMKRETRSKFRVMHLIEVIDEAMHG